MGSTLKVTKVETREFEAYQFNLDNKKELEDLLAGKGYTIKYKEDGVSLYKDSEGIPEYFKLGEHCCLWQKRQVNIFLIDKDYIILDGEYIHNVVSENEFNKRYIKVD